MTIYISGKISNNKHWKQHFKKAESFLKRTYKNCVVLSPLHFVRYEKELSYEDFMKLDFTLIDICDTMYMLNNWKESKGAEREYHYAQAKNKLFMYE